jgi:hypothetical protein
MLLHLDLGSSWGILDVALRYDCCVCRFAAISRFFNVSFDNVEVPVTGRCNILDICEAFLGAASSWPRSRSYLMLARFVCTASWKSHKCDPSLVCYFTSTLVPPGESWM